MSTIVDEEIRKKFDKDNKTVRGHLLNHMSNPLFDLFVTFKFAKIIWEKSGVKYGVEDAKKKKYVVDECCIFIVLMTSQSWNMLISMRTCVPKF